MIPIGHGSAAQQMPQPLQGCPRPGLGGESGWIKMIWCMKLESCSLIVEKSSGRRCIEQRVDGQSCYSAGQTIRPSRPLAGSSKAGRNPPAGAAVSRKVYQPTTTPETGVRGERNDAGIQVQLVP